MYDFTIIGGGPAGATAARLLGKRYKVLLIDRRSLFDEMSSGKCCGGLLAPDAQKVLAKFDLGIPKRILSNPQIFSVKTIDFDNDMEASYQRHYINFDRAEFEGWMLDMIPDNVGIYDKAQFVSYKTEDDFISVKFVKSGGEYEIETKYLIGADGANSKLREMVYGKTRNKNLYFSIQDIYEIEEEIPYFTAIFDKEITDYYSWTIPKDGKIYVGSAMPMTEKNYKEKMDLLEKKLRHKRIVDGEKIGSEGAHIYRPRDNRIYKGKDNIYLLGEAGGFISPSSSEGISYALLTAKYLSDSTINGKLDEDSYFKQLESLRRNIFIKNCKSLVYYNKSIRRSIIKSGIKAL